MPWVETSVGATAALYGRGGGVDSVSSWSSYIVLVVLYRLGRRLGRRDARQDIIILCTRINDDDDNNDSNIIVYVWPRRKRR